jgi:hypothetical protein
VRSKPEEAVLSGCKLISEMYPGGVATMIDACTYSNDVPVGCYNTPCTTPATSYPGADSKLDGVVRRITRMTIIFPPRSEFLGPLGHTTVFIRCRAGSVRARRASSPGL